MGTKEKNRRTEDLLTKEKEDWFDEILYKNYKIFNDLLVRSHIVKYEYFSSKK